MSQIDHALSHFGCEKFLQTLKVFFAATPDLMANRYTWQILLGVDD
jgi:hypothetical protein